MHVIREFDLHSFFDDFDLSSSLKIKIIFWNSWTDNLLLFCLIKINLSLAFRNDTWQVAHFETD